jgi:hypothetical protein
MRKLLSGLCAVALLTLAGCTDSNQGGMGANPSRERTPSASPPTSPSPSTMPSDRPADSRSPSSSPTTPTPSTPSR